MKYFIYQDIENEQVYELYKKTQKHEQPKHCDSCEKPIKKGMYFCESDTLDYYCLNCCQT